MTSAIDATLVALADATRREAVEVLAEGPLTPSEIATRVGVSRAALTGHLRSLRLAGLVEVALEADDGFGGAVPHPPPVDVLDEECVGALHR